MDKIFKFIGKQAGKSLRKSNWVYQSIFGSESDAIKAENVVGKELAAKIKRTMPLDNNPAFADFLYDIGEKLVAKLNNHEREFSFSVLKSGDINAFTLPGGYIFITDSLLNISEFNKDEIAFILAHEIGHVVRWHIFNKTIADSSLNLLAMISKPGGMLGSVITRTINNLMRSSYSQEQELEADSFGLKLVFAAGFNINAAPVSLERIGNAHSGESQVFNYFSSHPSIAERVEKLKKEIYKLEL